MANDGKSAMVKFTKDQLDWFVEFRKWDMLNEKNQEKMYEEFIKGASPGVAVNALHLYELYKKQEMK